jgi:hypothetical protein
MSALSETLEVGLRNVPQVTTQREVSRLLSAWVGEYLAQHFAVALLRSTSEGETERLEELLRSITGGES